jgi:hypothetical protein
MGDVLQSDPPLVKPELIDRIKPPEQPLIALDIQAQPIGIHNCNFATNVLHYSHVVKDATETSSTVGARHV